MTEHYFLYPFGINGTLLAVPNPTQVSGTVSYQSGFPVGYELANTTPGYLSIPRNQFNQVLFDTTSAIQQIQQTGFPSWITAAANGGSSFQYALGAEVWYNGVPYRSLIANNTDTPPSSNWAVIGQNRSLYFNFATDTGSQNHMIIAPNPAMTSYADGNTIEVGPAFGNTGACDINVNSLGVASIKTLQNQDPPASTIIPSGRYTMTYNASTGCFVVQNPALGTAAYLNVGTSANQVVQLTSGAVIPNGLGVVKSVKKQIFTSSGTYTPSTGMLYCIAEVVAAGGGSGGCNGAAAMAGGGGSGSYSRSYLSASTVGASQTVTVGTGGTAGANTGGNGGAGGASSIGSLVTTNGGNGGTGSTSGSGSSSAAGGAGGAVGTGDLTIAGQNGLEGNYLNGVAGLPGYGGSTPLGSGGQAVWGVVFTTGQVGATGTGYGSGAGGSSGTSKSGGAGSNGIVIITEFCSQ